MFELRGKYNKAKIFAENVNYNAVSQVVNLCNQRFAEGSKIRLMPDIHAGKGCTIGTTMTITDKVVPNLVGSDIGCGMHTVKLKEKRIELPKLDSVIRKNIPSGGEYRESPLPKSDVIDVESFKCYGKRLCSVNPLSAQRGLGTLGGGNHFIEVDKDEEGNLYLIIHTGSRKLGKAVAEWYQNEAYELLLGNREGEKRAREELIASLKSEGRDSEIKSALKNFQYKKVKSCGVPFEFAYCEGKLFNSYIYDMKHVQEYAYYNRVTIANIILKEMKLHAVDEFDTVHNYIDTETMILRKGAVSAKKGERLLIPINMRDGSLICIGKGNDDWNQSAPHGAGRLLSRSEAKESFTVNQFKKEMEGIYSTSIGRGTLDESPMAYKPMNDIVNNIGDTVEIEKVLKPIYNFKAGEQEIE